MIRSRPFALDGAPLMHAMAITRRYVVVLDLPVCYQDAAALVGTRFPYSWRPRRPARVGLVPRWNTDPVRWFTIESCYVFHSVNAYDDGDRVVLDVTSHPRAFDPAIGAAHDAVGPPCLRRWTFDLRRGVVRARPLPAGAVSAGVLLPEMVLVDDRVRGRRHRYLFGTTGGPRATATLTRLDLRTGAVRSWEFGAGMLPGQPVFVPATGSDAEGEGWLVVTAENPGRSRSDLLVFDALDLAAPPRATVRLPVGLPSDGRTTWLGREETGLLGDRTPVMADPTRRTRGGGRTGGDNYAA